MFSRIPLRIFAVSLCAFAANVVLVSSASAITGVLLDRGEHLRDRKITIGADGVVWSIGPANRLDKPTRFSIPSWRTKDVKIQLSRHAQGSPPEVVVDDVGSSTGIAAAPDGRIWMVDTDGSIVCYDPAKNKITRAEYHRPVLQAGGVATAPNGTIWFQHYGDHLDRYESGAQVAETMALGVLGQVAMGITVAADGLVWTSTDVMLHAFDPGQKKIVAALRHHLEPAGDRISMAAAADGGLWVSAVDAHLMDRVAPVLRRYEPTTLERDDDRLFTGEILLRSKMKYTEYQLDRFGEVHSLAIGKVNAARAHEVRIALDTVLVPDVINLINGYVRADDRIVALTKNGKEFQLWLIDPKGEPVPGAAVEHPAQQCGPCVIL